MNIPAKISHRPNPDLFDRGVLPSADSVDEALIVLHRLNAEIIRRLIVHQQKA
jgi:hypothetical protein